MVHPLDGELAVSDWSKRALFKVLTTEPASLAASRAAFLKRVLELRCKLEPDEQKLHSKMPPHINRVMQGKKLLLLKALLEELGYDDLEVMHELIHGVPLTGMQSVPPYAERKVKEAPSNKEVLESEAKWRSKAIISKSTPSVDRQVLADMGDKEVQSGFLSGPFHSPEEVTEALGRADWLANSRFVLYQGIRAKPRVIDDAKSSGLNDAYSSGEKLKLQTIDYVAVLCLLAGKLSARPVVHVELSTGETLTGQRVSSCPSWTGRTLDLRKAYKQMAVSEQDRHLMVLTHEGPDGRLFYISDALPFGARGSVFSFLRTSRALSFLMNIGLSVPSSVFFDDFPSISEGASAASAFDGPHTLLSALGWLYAADEEKCRPFASSFEVLGCRLNLSELSKGSLTMENREGRLETIRTMVDKLRSADDPRTLVPVVQGHLNFASSFIMGRALQPLSRSLGWKLAPDDFTALCDSILATLGKCKPRVISWHSPAPPILLFTDASYEGQFAGIGVVVLGTLGGRPEVFDGSIPESLIKHWQITGQTQVISQAELAVIVAMRGMLKARFAGRRLICFVDNEAARFSLIKGTSGKASMQRLTAAFHEVDLEVPCVTWVERVPSASNPSDDPSRGRTAQCIQALGGVYAGQIKFSEEVLLAITSSTEQTASLKRNLTPLDVLDLLPGLAA